VEDGKDNNADKKDVHADEDVTMERPKEAKVMTRAKSRIATHRNINNNNDYLTYIRHRPSMAAQVLQLNFFYSDLDM
jgi:hypothetical protein